MSNSEPLAPHVCRTCKGTGEVKAMGTIECPTCRGSGERLCNAHHGGEYCQWLNGHYGAHVLGR